MSLRVEIPSGLKEQECKHGGVWATTQTLIRYVPEVDPIRDKTNENKTLKAPSPTPQPRLSTTYRSGVVEPTRIF